MLNNYNIEFDRYLNKWGAYRARYSVKYKGYQLAYYHCPADNNKQPNKGEVISALLLDAQAYEYCNNKYDFLCEYGYISSDDTSKKFVQDYKMLKEYDEDLYGRINEGITAYNECARMYNHFKYNYNASELNRLYRLYNGY